ncbi:hypothetical protein [Bosea sp. (in: a-proteobacteria)]|uniref:hypothetical protein n=1 Tax=Bosea sp. (in: a-proteobacteria) TaxID=1871050 RepID=UPI003F71CB22
MRFARYFACGLVLPVLAGCTTTGPVPGTPEFTAARVSRGYDCGVRIDRGRVIARLAPADRGRFIAANASFAVKSYKAPRLCDASERDAVQRELASLAKR